MKNNIIDIGGIILIMLVPLISNGAEPYKPFIKKQYPSNDFTISQADFRHGDVLITIAEAKKISKKYDGPPYLCRTWLSVNKSNKTIYRKYFDDIDAVGFSYGLFIPKVQLPFPYFAVVKNGDYDGRIFSLQPVVFQKRKQYGRLLGQKLTIQASRKHIR